MFQDTNSNHQHHLPARPLPYCRCGSGLLPLHGRSRALFDWTLTSSDPWLKVDQDHGNTQAATTVNVWADLTGLPAQTYQAALTINSEGIENSPYVIPVTFRVQEETSGLMYLPLIIRR